MIYADLFISVDLNITSFLLNVVSCPDFGFGSIILVPFAHSIY